MNKVTTCLQPELRFHQLQLLGDLSDCMLCRGSGEEENRASFLSIRSVHSLDFLLASLTTCLLQVRGRGGSGSMETESCDWTRPSPKQRLRDGLAVLSALQTCTTCRVREALSVQARYSLSLAGTAHCKSPPIFCYPQASLSDFSRLGKGVDARVTHFLHQRYRFGPQRGLMDTG